jgi:hypothetical protein
VLPVIVGGSGGVFWSKIKQSDGAVWVTGGDDCADTPLAFTAETVYWYCCPVVRPESEAVTVLPETEVVIPGTHTLVLYILYEVAPDTLVHDRLIVLVPHDPAVADRLVGALGGGGGAITVNGKFHASV